MRQIIKDRQIVDDVWQHVPDDAILPDGPVIVSSTRWRAERETLLARREQGIGLRLKNDEEVSSIQDDLAALAIIALEFPVFRDGRAFSQAHLLRERYRYHGEIRATGDVLRDQLFFMYRSGFNAFELRIDQNLPEALEAFTEFTVTYQPAVDEPQPLYRRAR